MQFTLTDALIDDILFAMEDQMGEFMLYTVEGVLISSLESCDFLDVDLDADDGQGGQRYISLPEWDSADGFRLMEHFVAGLRNPVIRDELNSALGYGKKVFRAFKDTLARHPETEKLWFSYKDKKMKMEIVRWYNGLMEEWGLEKIGVEPDDTEDLVLEDFRFRPFQKEDIFRTEELHRRCLDEYIQTLAEADAGFFQDGILKKAQALKDNSKLSSEDCMVAESRGNELAGYVCGKKAGSVMFIQNLEVKPEFRGLGIGEALLAKFLDSLDPLEIDQVFLDLPSGMENFSRVLHRESFKPYMVRYWLKLCNRQGG